MACIAAICGVVFLLHLVDTPPRFDFSNQFEDYLQEKIDNLDPNDEFTDLNIKEKEKKLNVFFDLCERFISESVIDTEIYNQKRLNYAGKYAQPFSMYCRTYFSGYQIRWSPQNIGRLEKRLNFLRDIPQFKEEYADQYSQINTYCEIIRSYHEAEKLLGQTEFKDLDLSRSRLHDAETLKSHEYLKNNLDLIRRLNQYPSKLNEAHVRFLEKQAERLKEYRNYTKEAYETLVTEVSSFFDDYNSLAESIYGNKDSNVDSVRTKSHTYRDDAGSYYQSKP